MINIVKSYVSIVKKSIHTNSKDNNRSDISVSFKDILYYSCHMNGNDESYELVNSYLKIHNIVDVSKKSLIINKNKINITAFENINIDMINYIYKNITHRIIAVDCTHLALLIKLNAFGYKLSKNKLYCKALISCLFDVEREIPINYSLFTEMNERNALKNQLCFLKKGDILLMDRGYFSKDLLFTLIDNDIDVVFRLAITLSEACDFMEENKKSKLVWITYYDHSVKLRLVKYYIDDKYYCLGTTLYNASINYLKCLYWQRWKIEINFRHSKYNLSMKEIKSTTDNGVRQDIAIHNFIFITSSYFQYEMQKTVKINTKINTSNMLYVVINELLYLMLYKNNNSNNIKEIMRILNIAKNVLVAIRPDRNFKRIRCKPSTKWNEFGNRYGNRKI